MAGKLTTKMKLRGKKEINPIPHELNSKREMREKKYYPPYLLRNEFLLF